MTTPFDRRYFLLIGIGLLLLVAASALTRETFEASRYRPGIVNRSEEPKRFWWSLVIYFIGGIFFVGLYLCQISN
jgi:hypothetical protein